MGNAGSELHVWEVCEITLEAQRPCANPYTEVTVWADLRGPGFEKRVYGFWDGGATFRIRLLATAPGTWRWTTGANQPDPGLQGRKGQFTAVAWTEAELGENPCRRGMVRAGANGRALAYADGTPCFLLGDTWWATPTFRYPWHDDDEERPIGPEMGFKDMVRFRKAQGFNCIGIIAALPNWANDGRPHDLRMEDAERTPIRSAWKDPASDSAKDMHNEGGRPFLFPGRVPGYEDVFPDVDRINPAYFQYLDRKIAYLNAQGFVPFIEVARRDAIAAWQRFYAWPDSYARYIQYVFSRYQAHNCIFSPIHFDWMGMTIPSREFNEPANLVIDTYGRPPFGTLLSANASTSTLVNFGGADEARWLSLHQIGNWRAHYNYWYLTEIFRSDPPMPALNGEPYYAGYTDAGHPRTAEPGSEEDDRNCRSGMYGSLLSGGLAGHIYGAQGLWGGDIEPEAAIHMWDAITWQSADQMRHLRTFALAQGARYQELIPDPDMVVPDKAGDPRGYTGWAYCAHTAAKDWLLLYFEQECPQGFIRSLPLNRRYQATWFDPRTGAWQDAGVLSTNGVGMAEVPPYPTEDDWGLQLVLVGE